MIQRLLVNTGSNLLVMIIKLVITFVMTPVFVSNLGKYDYGLWEMVAGIVGYMGMLDLGIRPAISRFAAKYNAEEDRENLLTVFTSTFFFMAFIGVMLLAFFSLWGIWFADSLAPEGEPSQRYTLWLLILGAQLMFMFPGYVAESYLEGFQKYYLKNNITIVNSIISAIIIYIYITPQNGLLLLAAANAIGLTIKYVAFFVLLARPVYGAIRVQVRSFSWVKLREIIVFGFKSFIQGLSTRIETSSDVIIIGLILGPAMVPFYSIPANLVQYLRTIGWTLTHAFMPLFSDMGARSEEEKIRQVYLRASKYVVGIIFPMAVGIVLLGGPFLGIWIGEEFKTQGEAIIIMLAVFIVFPFINPFVSRYLTAINKHGIFARFTPLAAAINVCLSLVLIKPFGLVGVAAASIVGVVIFVPIYLRFSCRQLHLPVGHYIRQSLVPCLMPTLLLAVTVLAMRFYFGIESYGMIVGTVLAAGAVWAVAFWTLAFDAEERNYIVSSISGLRRGGG